MSTGLFVIEADFLGSSKEKLGLGKVRLRSDGVNRRKAFGPDDVLGRGQEIGMVSGRQSQEDPDVRLFGVQVGEVPARLEAREGGIALGLAIIRVAQDLPKPGNPDPG